MESIDARVEKVEQDGDWYTIFTDDPTVKKLTTMKEELAGQAASFRLKGVRGRIKFTEKTRTADGGRVFKNRYFEGIEEIAATNGGGIPGIDQAAPAAAGAGSRKTDPDDAWRMALSTGAKLAVETMPMMPVESRDFETQKRIMLAWAYEIFFTPKPTTRHEPLRQFAGGPGAYDEPGPREYDRPPAPTDDDIPY